jgi:hypothetical protein
MSWHPDDDYRPGASRWQRPLRFVLYGLYGLLNLMAACGGGLLLVRLTAAPQPSAAVSTPLLSGVPEATSSPPLQRAEELLAAPPLPALDGPVRELQAPQSPLRDAAATFAMLRTANQEARTQMNALSRERKTLVAMSRSAPARALPPPEEPTSPPVQQAFGNDANRPRVVIHYRGDSPAGRDEAATLAQRLLNSAFLYGETRTVAATPRAPTIRYFFPADADAAARLAALLRGSGEEFRVQDMTAFRPAPARGMLEVWVSR